MTPQAKQTPPAETPAPEAPQGAPSADDMKKFQAMGEAAATAQQEGRDVAQALKDKRDEVGLQMSDADIDKMSEQLFGKLENLFRESGALDPPLDVVSAPEPPPPTPEPPAATAGAEEIPPPEAPAPRKPTFAERFFGTG